MCVLILLLVRIANGVNLTISKSIQERGLSICRIRPDDRPIYLINHEKNSNFEVSLAQSINQ